MQNGYLIQTLGQFFYTIFYLVPLDLCFTSEIMYVYSSYPSQPVFIFFSDLRLVHLCSIRISVRLTAKCNFTSFKGGNKTNTAVTVSRSKEPLGIVKKIIFP